MSTLIPTRPSRLNRYMSGDPFASFHDEMSQLINDFFDRGNGETPSVITPSFDLSETDDAFQIEMDLPGVDAGDIDIELRDNTVTVCGERKSRQEQEGKSFHRVERQWGRFCRTVQLPSNVQRDKVEAECTKGILTIRLPKSAESLTQHVPVKAG